MSSKITILFVRRFFKWFSNPKLLVVVVAITVNIVFQVDAQ